MGDSCQVKAGSTLRAKEIRYYQETMLSCHNAIYLKDPLYKEMQQDGLYITSSAKMVKTMLVLNCLLPYLKKKKNAASFSDFILVTHLPVTISVV